MSTLLADGFFAHYERSFIANWVCRKAAVRG
jgi:hypothetical protein